MIRVLLKDNEIYFIANLQGCSFIRKGIPSSDENIVKDWERQNGTPQFSMCKTGESKPFRLHYNDDTLLGIKSKTDDKITLFKTSILDPVFVDIYKRSTPGDFLVVAQYDIETPAFRLIDIHNGDVIAEKEVGKKSLFTWEQRIFVSRYGHITWYLFGLLIFPITIAGTFTWLMDKYRISYFVWQEQQIQYASIWQRTLASIIDLIIIGGILIIVFMIFDWEKYFIAAGIIPAVGMFIVFVYMEGKWGGTPGKYIMKIRVANLEMRPCGFWSSLSRNLLKYAIEAGVIGFFTIALTERWQRVGDLLAKTIVMKKEGIKARH
ncbi:MAG: hypothetical protein A2Y62_19880 [Candidatus Fischerbacteria bacterium RBG_13_37_8]|uniref:RDD domain-containing protein n=1 Tax=Candidatus Fischerbacteria bacterium RBG_13_37_8 TaxID=1817863 RepID=A0A1F5VNU5_9BACT|nr:MAG: hypothetical protein A2Y62_19880 [Candidatus Fischerbacteria bacterium RBG_13_37_8]